MRLYLYLRNFPAEGRNFNNRYAGLIKSVHGLASGLAATGVDVTILSEASPTHTTVHQSPAGYTIRCFAQPVQHRPTFKLSPDLRRYLRQTLHPSDLVILNGILHPTLSSLSRLLRRQRVPYIVAPHDPYTPEFFRRSRHKKWPYWYLLERPMLQQAIGIQVLDQRHQQCLQRLDITTPVIATPNGFHPEDSHFEPAPWQPGNPIRLMFLGRFDAYNKGLDLLVEAVHDLSHRHPLQLTFQGSTGDDRAALEARVAELHLQHQVKFLDPDYTQAPSQLIQQHDVFCVPSRFEGFSLAALEAMLAGRVLLVSEIAGVAPHIKASDCGVVVQPAVASIKAGLEQLLQRRDDWVEMGDRGRRYVLEELCWKTIATTALTHYQTLVA
ncbi:MAG: glycosyltransferase [Leptolyngbyaceae cyanobacterium]